MEKILHVHTTKLNEVGDVTSFVNGVITGTGEQGKMGDPNMAATFQKYVADLLGEKSFEQYYDAEKGEWGCFYRKGDGYFF